LSLSPREKLYKEGRKGKKQERNKTGKETLKIETKSAETNNFSTSVVTHKNKKGIRTKDLMIRKEYIIKTNLRHNLKRVYLKNILNPILPQICELWNNLELLKFPKTENRV
jgi:hypothetical protein